MNLQTGVFTFGTPGIWYSLGKRAETGKRKRIIVVIKQRVAIEQMEKLTSRASSSLSVSVVVGHPIYPKAGRLVSLGLPRKSLIRIVLKNY